MNETIEYLWYKIEVTQDEYPTDPREWSELWTMLCNHWRYNLWDEKLPEYWESFENDFIRYINDEYDVVDKDYEDMSEREMNRIAKYIDNNIIYYPLYLYDHSWISMSIWDPKDRWDSWQVWFIYTHREDIKQWNDLKTLRTHHIDDARRLLRREVEIYNRYLTWEIYEYHIEYLDENAWWYESIEEAIADAKSSIDVQDPEGKTMRYSNKLYEIAIWGFWDRVNEIIYRDIIDEDWQEDETKRDMIVNIIWDKLRNY